MAAVIGNLDQFRRINVVGTSGSGKTTFAHELAALLTLPCVEMDAVFWKPDWQQPDDEEFLPAVERACAGPQWVLDGNYTRTLPIKWGRTQLVIWLDISFARTVFRVARRAVRRSISQEELWPGTGNRESFAKTFLSRDSIVLWAMKTHRRNRRKYHALMDSPDYKHVVALRLGSAPQARTFLEAVRRDLAADPG